MNTNTFENIFKYLELVKKSNIINTWLLAINSAILLFIIKNALSPSKTFMELIKLDVFKWIYLILFIWLILNVFILIIYTYKEKLLSLIIKDLYFRLKSFLHVFELTKNITEKDFNNTSILKIHGLSNEKKLKDIINKEYINKLINF